MESGSGGGVFEEWGLRYARCSVATRKLEVVGFGFRYGFPAAQNSQNHRFVFYELLRNQNKTKEAANPAAQDHRLVF